MENQSVYVVLSHRLDKGEKASTKFFAVCADEKSALNEIKLLNEDFNKFEKIRAFWWELHELKKS
ncbi:MAG: hypothetical protein AABY22_18750 [Nanoarchaeota archaeon]